MKENRAHPGLVLLLVLAAGSAALLRMAEAIAPWEADPGGATHYYEYLTEGFMSGHTALSIRPAQDLLALADPYRPGQRVSQRLLDASLYRGKYYIYYGPGPAVLLMLPWRALTGRELPQRMAVALLGCAGLAALALLLLSVRRRHFPAASGAALAWAFACALFGSWLLVVIRRPLFWELPIVCAVACLWWATYFAWRFRESGGGARWAVAAGLALSFMIASRATCIFAAAAILALMLVPVGAPGARGIRWRPFLGATAIVLACGIGLLAYNVARFGSWHEFGQSYQLWGDDYRNMRFLSAAYVPFNLRMYFFSIARPSPYFPFVRPSLPTDGPSGYMGVDEVYGVLFAAPVQFAGLAALAWVLRRRGDPSARSLLITLGAALGASLLAAAVLLSWGGACSRYAAELWAGWTVVTAVGVLAVFGTEGRFRRILRLLIGVSGVWTGAFVLLASADYCGIARVSRPRAYAQAARLMDYPSLWWARASGMRYGPVDLAIRIPQAPATGTVALLESGRRDRLNQLLLVRATAGAARLELVEDGSRVVLASPEFPCRGGQVRVRVAAPWLYPPAAHPFWDAFPDPASRRAMQTGYALVLQGEKPLAAEAASEDAEELVPRTATEADPGSAVGWVESMERAGSAVPPP